MAEPGALYPSPEPNDASGADPHGDGLLALADPDWLARVRSGIDWMLISGIVGSMFGCLRHTYLSGVPVQDDPSHWVAGLYVVVLWAIFGALEIPLTTAGAFGVYAAVLIGAGGYLWFTRSDEASEE